MCIRCVLVVHFYLTLQRDNMLMIRWTIAALVFSSGMVRAMDNYDQQDQGLQVIVDLMPVDQEFANVMAEVFTVLDDVKDALSEQENNTELRALRHFNRECLKARKEKNVSSMLVVLDGMRGLYQLVALPVEVQRSLEEVIGGLECLALPEDCVWRQDLSEVTNDMHVFVDALVMMVPLSMTIELQKLTVKISDLLEIGTLEAFSECVVAFKRFPTLLNNRGMQRVAEQTVPHLLWRLLKIPIVHNPHQGVHCVCGGCE